MSIKVIRFWEWDKHTCVLSSLIIVTSHFQVFTCADDYCPLKNIQECNEVSQSFGFVFKIFFRVNEMFSINNFVYNVINHCLDNSKSYALVYILGAER